MTAAYSSLPLAAMMSTPSWRRPAPRGACQVSPNQHLPWTGKTSMVTATAAGGAGAGAGALPSRLAVASSSLPVGVRPERRWNSMIAPAVAAPNDTVGAAGEGDAGRDERVLQRRHPGAALAVHRESGGRGDALRCCRCAAEAEHGCVLLRHTPVCGVPFVFWKAISAVRVALPKTPSAPPRNTSPVVMRARCSSLDEVTGRSDRHADVGARCRGRRCRRRSRRWCGCRCGGEGEAGDRRVVEDARCGQTLGLLVAGQCRGRHGAEHAVGSTAHGDACGDERPLEDLHVLATCTDRHAGERGVRRCGGRRGSGEAPVSRLARR